ACLLAFCGKDFQENPCRAISSFHSLTALASVEAHAQLQPLRRRRLARYDAGNYGQRQQALVMDEDNTTIYLRD
ncbi:hypothetical protein, partial [uncultured Desulfovibrio sp.]|uniref:hypothetical protein n=1 Tax=uncultured Desulfovibrio sp. TaxID=167968 RepID=UPI002670AEEF